MPNRSMPIKAARVLLLSFLVLLFTACGGGGGSGGGGGGGLTAIPPETLKLALQPVATGLDSPVFLTAPSGDTRLFIVERSGKIRIVQNATLLVTPFLDISDRTTTDNERGLLSMAFHPQYATNGFFFVFYTDINGNLVIERFSARLSSANVANPLSGLRILTIPHPTFGNHNGGLVAFGPDGFLYLGTGDGGGAGDPFGNAQNTNSLLGKLLRIDVNAATVAQPYTIPPTNPFINQSGKRPEIWAYGLRNPWRYAFDTTLLYIADVGQNRREEVDIAGVGHAGLNYGWNITEGTLCFPGDPCNKQGITLPIIERDHLNNRCSITGGYVYRGTAIPEMQGRYFYSDFCAGQLQSFFNVNGTATEQKDWGIQNVAPILSFGEDAQHELYLLSENGNVYRIVRE